MANGLEIDYDTADRITVCALQEHLGYLREEVREHVEDGAYMHPEDYHKSMRELIPALETLIRYFGGEV